MRLQIEENWFVIGLLRQIVKAHRSNQEPRSMTKNSINCSMKAYLFSKVFLKLFQFSISITRQEMICNRQYLIFSVLSVSLQSCPIKGFTMSYTQQKLLRSPIATRII